MCQRLSTSIPKVLTLSTGDLVTVFLYKDSFGASRLESQKGNGLHCGMMASECHCISWLFSLSSFLFSHPPKTLTDTHLSSSFVYITATPEDATITVIQYIKHSHSWGRRADWARNWDEAHEIGWDHADRSTRWPSNHQEKRSTQVRYRWYRTNRSSTRQPRDRQEEKINT